MKIIIRLLNKIVSTFTLPKKFDIYDSNALRKRQVKVRKLPKHATWDDIDDDDRKKEAEKLGLSSDSDWDEICAALIKKRPS